MFERERLQQVSLPLPPAAAYDECSPVTVEKREVQLARRVPSWNHTETRQSRAVSLLFVEMHQRGEQINRRDARKDRCLMFIDVNLRRWWPSVPELTGRFLIY